MQNADVAAGPLFVTEHRKEVVDFTVPFLTVQATLLLRKTPAGTAVRIRTLGDLVGQSEIRYGTLDKGVIIRALKRANDTVTRAAWREIQRARNAVLTASNEAGIARVRTEKYAFILPDLIGEYMTPRPPCDLVTAGRFLMTRGYGLALQKRSPYLDPFNGALRALGRAGTLDELRRRWWTGRDECGDGRGAGQMGRMYGVGSGRSMRSEPLWTFLNTVAVTVRIVRRRRRHV